MSIPSLIQRLTRVPVLILALALLASFSGQSRAQGVTVSLDAGRGVNPFFATENGTATNGLTLRIGTFNSASDADIQALGYNLLWVNNQFTIMDPLGGITTGTISSQDGSFATDGTTYADWFTSEAAALSRSIWLVYSDNGTLTSSTQYGVVSSTDGQWDMPASYSGADIRTLDTTQVNTIAFGSSNGTASTSSVRTATTPATYLYWDSNGGAGLGGDGTWSSSTTDTEWTTESGGSATDGPYAWGTTSGTDYYAGAGLTAYFGGTAGTVTVSGTVDTHKGMEIVTNGYTLSTGTINLAGSTATDNTITVATGDTATISSVLTGSAGLTKSGAGNLTLSGANTFTGATTISAGTLATSGANRITDSSAVTVDSGAVFALGGTETIGSIAGAGTVSLGSNTLTAGGDNTSTTFSGSLTGTGGLTKAGTGSLTLSGSSSYSGATTIGSSGGTININNAAAIGSGALTIGGASTTIDNTSGGAITLSNNNNIALSGGSLTFTGSNNLSFGTGVVTLSGATSRTMTINGGTLTVGSIDANAADRALTKNGAGTLVISGSAGANFQAGTTLSAGTLTIGHQSALGTGAVAIGSGTLTASTNLTGAFSVANNLTITTTGAAIAGANDLTLSGNITNSGGNRALLINKTGSTTLSGNIFLSDNSGTGRTLTLNTATDVTASGVISNFDGSGTAGNLIKQGAGTLILTGANTYTGTTTISAGALQIGNGGTTGSLSTSSTITNTASLVFNRSDTITQGTDFANGIAGTAGTLTQNGSGSLVLSGSNSYTGATNINTGIIRASNANSFGSTAGGVTVAGGAALELSGGISIGAEALSLSGSGISSGGALRNISGDNTYGGAVTLAAASRINSDAGLLTLSNTIGGVGQNLTIGGAGNTTISGAIGTTTGTLTKDGLGTLILSANSTYTGATTISAGTLQLGVGGNTGNITSDITNNSALVVNRANNFTFANVISGTGSLTKEGAGAMTLSGINTFTGNTTINGGSIRLGGAADSDTLTGNITINSGGTLDYSSTNNNQIKDTASVTIAGGTFNAAARTETIAGLTITSGTFTKDGGTFALGAGGVNMSGGNLAITTSTGTLSLGAASTFSGGTVLLSGTGSRINTSGTTTLGNATFSYNNASNSSQGLVLDGDILVSSSATVDFTNANTGLGEINLGSAARVFDVGSGANMNVGWFIDSSTSSGTLTKNGTGTLTLSAANAYTGATTINAGTIVLNGSNTNSATTINSGGTLEGTGSAGGTTVNSGGLISPGGSSIGTLATSSLTLNGGGGYTFSIGNVSGTPGTEWDLINVGSGSGLVTINSSSGTPFTIYLNGNPTGWSDSGTYAWDIISSSNLSGFAADKFAVDLGGFTPTPTGTFYFSNSGTALVLNYAILGDSTWSGGTGNWDTGFTPPVSNTVSVFFTGAGGGTATNNISSGTLDTLGTITFNSTAGAYTLAANSGSAGDSATPLVVTGSIVNNSTADQTVNLAMSFNGDRVVDAASGNISIGGVINGVGGLTKNGSSTLTLTQSNTFTGAVQVNAGTLATTGSGGFANTANVTVASGATYSVGANDQINSLTSPGSLTLSSGTLTISSSTANSSITGAISGAGGLIKAGTGTLTITNNNSGYSGETRLEGGVLEIGHNSALGTGAVALREANSTLRSTDSTDRSLSNVIGSITGSNGTIYTFGSVGTGNITFTDTGSVGIGSVTRVFNVLNANTTFGQIFSNSGSITKTGAGTLIFTGNSTYTGATTISSGTLQIGAGGSTGSIASTAIVNNSALVVDRTGTLTLSGNMSGTGTLTKNGSGTLVLSGSNTQSGATTLNAGTLTLQSSNALGTGSLTQSSGSSLLTIDTIGTLSNTMSLYNVAALQSATLSGGITVNNATFDVESGDTLTLSGSIDGTGGVTKNGTGSLVLSGSNTYSGATTVNAGILEAANANALGTNATVTVNGGSLLVSADDAINGKNLTLASSATGNGTAASLAFSGTYNGTAGQLTLSADSIIDLGTGSVVLHFTELVMGAFNLSIYNWTGTTLWGGGDGNNTDQFYIDRTLTGGELDRISFYSGIDSSSFVGTGYQLSGGSFANEVIPVPEPETYATALLLLLGLGLYLHRQRQPAKATAFTRPGE